MMKKPSRTEAEQYNAYYSADTPFAAHARLWQSKWSAKHGYPAGKLGNYLEPEFATANKDNYLTDKIKALVQYEVYAQKNDGKLISEPRIWDNLLSSQPLCFNMFGELHFDLKLATRFFRQLFPAKVKQVTAVRFEHSPGRGHSDYTGDHSAFDVFVEYSSHSNARGFIGIEVKYAESLKDDKNKAAATFAKHQNSYLKLTLSCGHFNASSPDSLCQVPLQQIWRDHLLSIATLKDYDEGCFVFLFPSQNEECQQAVNSYLAHLTSASEEITGFYPRYLEQFVDTMLSLCPADWTKELKERYFGAAENA